MTTRFTFVFVMLSLFCTSAARSADLDMPGLMRLFANNKNIRAEFIERKYVRILDAPVES